VTAAAASHLIRFKKNRQTIYTFVRFTQNNFSQSLGNSRFVIWAEQSNLASQIFNPTILLAYAYATMLRIVFIAPNAFVAITIAQVMRFSFSAWALCHAFGAIIEFIASNAFGAKFATFKLMVKLVATSPISWSSRVAFCALGAFLAVRPRIRALHAFFELCGFSEFFARQTPTHYFFLMRVGNNFTASTDGKAYVGNNLKISGDGNTVTGNNNTVNGDGNTVTGNNNKINGDGNRCTGNNNTLKGDGNTATGANNTINGKAAGGVGKKRGNSGFSVSASNIGGRTGQDGSWSTISPFGGVMNFNNHPGSVIGNVGDGGEIQIGGSVLRGVAPGATIQKDANGGWSMRTGGVTMSFGGDGVVMNTFGEALSPCMSPPSSPPPESPKYVEVPRETEKDDPVAEDAPDASSCISCTESVSVCVVLPCMHKCVCCKCARELGKDGTAEQKSVKCPICRGEIEAIKRVY
jgi:hypothetical protein